MRNWEVGIKYSRHYTLSVGVSADGPKQAFVKGYELLLKEERSDVGKRVRAIALRTRPHAMNPRYFVQEEKK